MKGDTRFYSVQPLNSDGSKDGALIHTDATSAQAAAEKALGESLSIHGKKPRASMWVMNDNLKPTLVTLYLPDPQLGGAQVPDQSSEA